jgi:class 3 adenylate cyclase
VQQQPVPWHAWPQSPVTVRMGLHTGRIMVHSQQNGRRDQGTILGDVVSMATRLQEHAAPGAILCSNATACLVRRTVGLDAMEPLPGQLVGEPIYAVRA